MHGGTKVGNGSQGCMRGKRQEMGLGVHEGKKRQEMGLEVHEGEKRQETGSGLCEGKREGPGRSPSTLRVHCSPPSGVRRTTTITA